MKKQDFEINVPQGFVPDEETQKLRLAVAAFNARIQPDAKDPDVTLREVAREVVHFRQQANPVKLGRFIF